MLYLVLYPALYLTRGFDFMALFRGAYEVLPLFLQFLCVSGRASGVVGGLCLGFYTFPINDTLVFFV